MVIEKDAPLRVAVLTNIIPRYRTPVFSKVASDCRFELRFFVSLPPELSDQRARDSLDLHQSKTLNIPWRTRTSSKAVVQKERLPIPMGMISDLLKFRPQLIITGDIGVRSMMAYLISKILRVPILIWTEETIEHAAQVGRLQKHVRRFLMHRVDGFLAWGRSASNYLIESGISESRITYCAQAVDNKEWGRRADASNSEELRAKLGVKGNARICLAVGRLLPRKGFKELLTAFGSMPVEIRNNHYLVLVGDGPEKENLLMQSRQLDLNNFIMIGSRSPEQLAAYYKAADFMVLPSLTDVWGLVVNEAMACGTPVIASIHAGATEELVKESSIGEAFDPNIPSDFSATLARWFENPPIFKQGASRDAIGRVNFDVTIEAITRLLENYAKKIK